MDLQRFNKRDTAVVLFSGGLDSYIMLRLQKELLGRKNVLALYVNYGSRHGQKEVEVSSRLCSSIGIPLKLVELPKDLFVGWGSSLLEGSPVVNRSLREIASDEINPAYVPNRNMILASIAGAIAISCFGFKGTNVCMGFHLSDGSAFVDTTISASNALDSCLDECSKGSLAFTSFAELKKAEVLEISKLLRISSRELSLTRSCYQGGDLHCGVCDACVVRHAAFFEAGIEDLTVYSAPVGV